MSRYKFIGLTSKSVSLIENWIAVAHTGDTVVPVDFHRLVDRFEMRPNPNRVWAAAVESIYRELLGLDSVGAQAVAALTFGAPPNRLRALRLTRGQADAWLLLFGFYVDRIDLTKIESETKLSATPSRLWKISEEFGDLSKPLPRETIRKDGSVWAGNRRVH